MVCMSLRAKPPACSGPVPALPGHSARAGTPSTSRHHVKRPTISAAHRQALARNIKLAEDLGATVVRVKADRPADGLIAFAQREGITHVIFGQTAWSRWEIVAKGSILNRFLEEVRDAAVQVVPLGDTTTPLPVTEPR